MNLVKVTKNLFDKGVFIFDNGNYIFIEEIAYSSDGLFWEDTFNPNPHRDPRDPNNILEGHKWRRVRHAGDDFFQEPEYIVAEDGKTPIFRIHNNMLQYKYEGEEDSSYRDIENITSLKGDKGNKGDRGEGWHVDLVGYWLEKPDCPNSPLTTAAASCTTCSGEEALNTNNTLKLFLSLGDGLKEIVSGDVGSFRSTDGVSWVEIVSTDVGNYTRFIANDALGTGSIDYHTRNSLGTRGKVYYCNEGRWSEFLNVAIPQFKLSPTESFYAMYQDGLFMENYVDTPLNTNPVYGTIAMTPDFKLVVKQNSLEPIHFTDGSFGDGLDEGTPNSDGLFASPIKVKASDFAGFGLDTYIGNDGNLDLEIDVRTLVGDGLFAIDDNVNNLDGEDRYLFGVRASDLISGDSGLETFVNLTDNYEDLRVKTGNGLFLDTNGVNVKVDNLSLDIDTNNNFVEIKEFLVGNDGVQAKHLNPNTADNNKAIKLDNSTGLYLMLSSNHNALSFDSEGVLVKEEGIQGWHLSSNVADEEAAMHFNTTLDVLQVKVKANGGIIYDADGLFIDTTNLNWLNGNIVKKVEVAGNDYSGDLVFEGEAVSDNYMKILVEASGQTITVKPETNLSNLTDLIDSRIASHPLGNHNHSISDITGLDDALNERVTLGDSYSNIQIASNGLFITPNGGATWGRISVDDNFNIFVDTNVTPA